MDSPDGVLGEQQGSQVTDSAVRCHGRQGMGQSGKDLLADEPRDTSAVVVGAGPLALQPLTVMCPTSSGECKCPILQLILQLLTVPRIAMQAE